MPSVPALPPPAAVDRIAALPCRDRMKRALALVADGMPYRDAAKEVGYRDHREVYRWAKRAGLLEVHTDSLWRHTSASRRSPTPRSSGRLIEHPEDIHTRDLAIIGGIAADKAAKYESWGRSQEADRGELLSQMLARLHESSVGLRLEVTPLPAIEKTIALPMEERRRLEPF